MYCYFRYFILLIIPSLTILLLTACGDGRGQQIIEEEPASRTLSILAPEVFVAVLGQAEGTMSEAWAAEGREFSIEVNTYLPPERETQLTYLQTLLMAGQGYDMFFWDGHPTWIHSASGLFANIYDLMDRHQATNPEAFYTNILEAWEFDGGLYIFPLSVDLSFIGISSNLPQHIIDRFLGLNHITIHEMMQIYLELHDQYGEEFAHMAFGSGMDIGHVIGGFIDFNNRRASLNEGEFAAYLENYKRILEINPEVDFAGAGVRMDGYNFFIEGWAKFYVFADTGWQQWRWPDTISAILEPPNPAFLNFIPLADRYGRAIIKQQTIYASYFPEFYWHYHQMAPTWGSISISNNEHAITAWEFTNHLITAMVVHRADHALRYSGRTQHQHRRHFGGYMVTSPIKREYHRSNMDAIIYNEFQKWGHNFPRRMFYGFPFEVDDAYDTFLDAINRLDEFNMRPAIIKPVLPGDLHEDIFAEFLMGTLTAGQAAAEIHNRVSLWLIE